MACRVLLMAESPKYTAELRAALARCSYDVEETPSAQPGASVPFCPLAVLELPVDRMRVMIARLRQAGAVSKVLAISHFSGASGVERRLRDAGADDVLMLPCTHARMEITLSNLHRLYVLERAAGAALGARMEVVG